MITLTETAIKQVKHLFDEQNLQDYALRVGIQGGGCSGLSYTLEFAEDRSEFDEVVEDRGVTIFIHPKAVMFLIGSEMDFVADKLSSGFVFNNPNEKGKCGCGESFHV